MTRPRRGNTFSCALCMHELLALMLDEPDAPNEVVDEMDRYDWSQADRVALGRVELVICDLVRCEEAAQVVARSLLAVLGTRRAALLPKRDEGCSSLIEELRVGAVRSKPPRSVNWSYTAWPSLAS